MDALTLRPRFHASIATVDAAGWDALATSEPPFLRHAFLQALEASGSVRAERGWTPAHLTLEDAQGRLHAALPLYLKQHSWGEFVFDFAWADAAQRAGLAYYPKLVAAVPFSPVACSKPMRVPGLALGDALRVALPAIKEFAATHGASGLHVLHAHEADVVAWQDAGCVRRTHCQYHWTDDGYGDHAGFLARQTRDRRKKVRQELRRVTDAGIRIEWVDGTRLAADAALAATVYACYAATYLVRGQSPYLTAEFWRRLYADLPDSVQVALAWRADTLVAVAICLRDANTLYGRHWGALESFRDLHFVLCYHAGIARCLELGLRRFEPGVQGEHKVWRGFAPSATWSAHWLADPGLHAAVATYCGREALRVEDQMAALRPHLPFRSAS